MSLPRNAHAPSPPSPPPLSYGTPAPPSSVQDRTVGRSRARTTDSTYLTPFQALRLPVPLILFIYTFDLKVQTRSAGPVGPPTSMCTRREARAAWALSGPLHARCESDHHARAHLCHQPGMQCSPSPISPIPEVLLFAGQRLVEATKNQARNSRLPKSGNSGTDQEKKAPFSCSKESLCGLAP
ncbi:hypothetical protein EDB85DRAFT_1982256 [Lactarius pseudohatsudake]|nr:hypothetical protein EDB85DRAFT_1982256 [Lactarius pseudohatsudake]